MDKKHLSFGIFISLCFLTFFMYHLRKVSIKNQVKSVTWIGVLNGQNVYLADAEKALGKQVNENTNLELFFREYIDHSLLSMEASKIGLSKNAYLHFFESIKNIPLTEEEKAFFKNKSAKEIIEARPKTAVKKLLTALYKQNKIHFNENIYKQNNPN